MKNIRSFGIIMTAFLIAMVFTPEKAFAQKRICDMVLSGQKCTTGNNFCSEDTRLKLSEKIKKAIGIKNSNKINNVKKATCAGGCGEVSCGNQNDCSKSCDNSCQSLNNCSGSCPNLNNCPGSCPYLNNCADSCDGYCYNDASCFADDEYEEYYDYEDDYGDYYCDDCYDCDEAWDDSADCWYDCY